MPTADERIQAKLREGERTESIAMMQRHGFLPHHRPGQRVHVAGGEHRGNAGTVVGWDDFSMRRRPVRPENYANQLPVRLDSGDVVTPYKRHVMPPRLTVGGDAVGVQ